MSCFPADLSEYQTSSWKSSFWLSLLCDPYKRLFQLSFHGDDFFNFLLIDFSLLQFCLLPCQLSCPWYLLRAQCLQVGLSHAAAMLWRHVALRLGSAQHWVAPVFPWGLNDRSRKGQENLWCSEFHADQLHSIWWSVTLLSRNMMTPGVSSHCLHMEKGRGLGVCICVLIHMPVCRSVRGS